MPLLLLTTKNRSFFFLVFLALIWQDNRFNSNLLHVLFIYEPRHNKTCLWEFPTRPDTNRPAQPQKLASLEISAIESRDIILSKQLICAFVVR